MIPGPLFCLHKASVRQPKYEAKCNGMIIYTIMSGGRGYLFAPPDKPAAPPPPQSPQTPVPAVPPRVRPRAAQSANPISNVGPTPIATAPHNPPGTRKGLTISGSFTRSTTSATNSSISAAPYKHQVDRDQPLKRKSQRQRPSHAARQYAHPRHAVRPSLRQNPRQQSIFRHRIRQPR